MPFALSLLIVAGCAKRKERSPAAVRYEAGMRLAREGEVARAAGEWQMAIALDPSDPRPYFALAEQWEGAGRPEEARAILERLEQARPETPHLTCRLAQILFVQGRSARALERAEAAVTRDPECGVASAVLGMALEEAGERGAAITALERAYQLNPTDERITLTLAQILSRAGREGDAGRRVAAVLAMNPRSSDAHFMHGWLRTRSAPVTAEPALRRALALDPDHFRAHAALGGLLARGGRFAAARSHLERARKDLPEDPEISRDLARVYRALRDPRAPALARTADEQERLLARYREALRRLHAKPGDRVAILDLARLERRRGDPEEALARVREVLRTDPNDAEALRLMHDLLGSK